MRWIVRVYALLPDEWGRYLVLEEYFRGGWILKFPGGGVEFSEGLIEALERELWEELRVRVSQVEHFYTTHFFQRSYYHDAARLLSVYYRVKTEEAPRLCGLRLKGLWLPPAFMTLTFPVDRYVRRLLMAEAGDAPLRSGSASGAPSDYLPPPAVSP